MTREQLVEFMGPVIEQALAKHLDAKSDEEKNPEQLEEMPPLQPQADGDSKYVIGAICRALAATKGDMDKAGPYAERTLKRPDAAKALDKALQLGDGAAGGFLVPNIHLPEVIELLRAQAVVRGMNPTIIPLTNGIATISKLTAGATGFYIGESQDITESQPATGLIQFRERKLAALVPISNDLLRVPSAQTNQVVQEDLVSAITLREDLAFLRGPGTEFEPRGITNFVPAANSSAANGTVNLDNVTIDLGELILALMNSNSRMLRPGWLMAPRSWHYLVTVRDGNGNFVFRDEMMQGRLWGWPFAMTTQIPINLGGGSDESEVVFADFADIVIADAMSLELEVSNEAAYATSGGIVAAFSRDETVVRAIVKHDLGVRHEESLAMKTAVTWGA